MGNRFLETTIGDQVTLQRGFDITRKQQEPGKIPVVSSGGIASYHNEFKVEGPGVVLGRKGTLGTVFYISDNYWPHDTSLWVKDFKGNSPQFVYYFFLSMSGTLKDMDVGAANPTLNRNHVHPTEILWPDKESQGKIAHILGSLDDKIEVNRKMNETLEAMAQALFKSWFVDFDPVIDNALAAGNEIPEEFSVRAETRQKILADNSKSNIQNLELNKLFPSEFTLTDEMGWIPKGWGVKPLYETAEYVNGASFKAKDFSSDYTGLPIVKIAELKQGISAQTKFTMEVFKDKYKICNGDMLYSWSGSPETSLEVFKWFGGEGWLNQHIFKINIKEKFQSKFFVYYILKHMKPILIETAKNKQTTGLGHITVADMKRLLVAYPSYIVMNTFNEKIRAFYEKSSLLDESNTQLSKLRDTLLPKLLSGELNLDKTDLT